MSRSEGREDRRGCMRSGQHTPRPSKWSFGVSKWWACSRRATASQSTPSARVRVSGLQLLRRPSKAQARPHSAGPHPLITALPLAKKTSCLSTMGGSFPLHPLALCTKTVTPPDANFPASCSSGGVAGGMPRRRRNNLFRRNGKDRV